MRLLHTADWHLGISTGPISRAEDHDRFLDWLLDRLSVDEVDVLLVAGDVFDTMQPSADALRRYYRFLARIAATGISQVVVVGGNHDSASRLQAPAPVLESLDVHVVGGVGPGTLEDDTCVVPLRDRAGEVRAVALAVPYIHEFRLGVRTTELDRSEARGAFVERFTQVYRSLTDRAEASWPGVPVVALGHMTVGEGTDRDEYPQEIHQVGTIDALPPDVFDPRIRYVALGHIHRCRPTDASRRAWYSGTPVATSLNETSTRKVLLVELDEETGNVSEVRTSEVPASRALLEIEGAPDVLVERVGGLRWDEPLPPLLFLRAVTDHMPSDLQSRLQEALGAHPEDGRPAIVELRQLRETELPESEARPQAGLDTLTPPQVFEALLRARGFSDADDLVSAFSELRSMTEDDVEAACARISRGKG
mgnify:CR=1 FL=1